MRKKESELSVIVKAKDLGSYLFTVMEKSPKKFRFTFVSRIQNLSLDIVENLYRANFVYVKDKEDLIHHTAKGLSAKRLCGFKAAGFSVSGGKRAGMYSSQTV